MNFCSGRKGTGAPLQFPMQAEVCTRQRRTTIRIEKHTTELCHDIFPQQQTYGHPDTSQWPHLSKFVDSSGRQAEWINQLQDVYPSRYFDVQDEVYFCGS